MQSWWLLLMFCEVLTEYYAGRIKPGKFEYPKMNGLMLVNDAKEKCESDLACAGFTFKGSYKTLNHAMQIYFFHFIPENNDCKYFYWSTYKVNRNFVILSNVTINSEMKYSQIMDSHSHNYKFLNNDQLLDYSLLRKTDVVAFHPQQNTIFSRIDFADILPSTNPAEVVVLNLNQNQMIYHTFPKIDRCCKLKGGKVKYDGIDNMKRIDCNMSTKEFLEKYINEREPVMMKGCQNEWIARNWTIENLLDRYRLLKGKPWDSYFQRNIEYPIEARHLNSESVRFAINNGYLLKVFQNLWRDNKGWMENNDRAMELMLDLFDEYSYPNPMPEDEFSKFHIAPNLAYLMLATAGTGTMMHIDPENTDAFNALISGEKWWVSFPKDLYEFRSEFVCNPQCSEPKGKFDEFGAWFTHILPQLRDRIFYGKKLKSFLQTSGETLYMPNMVLHSVWNISPSISVGENPLYNTSLDEWIGSGGDDKSSSAWIRSRIIDLSKGKTKSRLNDIMEQMDEAITKHGIIDYMRPVISAY